MKAGTSKKFNLGIDTGDDDKDISPKASGFNRKSPFNRSPFGGKSPLSRKFANYKNPQMTNASGVSAVSSAYQSRRITPSNIAKSPRDMWRKPDNFEESEESDNQLETLVKEEDDVMVFETDAPEVDFDKLNDQEAQDMHEANNSQANKNAQDDPEDYVLVKGSDVITGEISTEAAYQYFMKLEESGNRDAPDLQLESGEIISTPRDALEVPSERIARLQKELDSLQEELVVLEKEEIPTNLPKDEQSAKEQLQQISDLRDNMHKMVSSAQFQALEAGTAINFRDIFKPQTPFLGDNEPAARKADYQNFQYESTQDLKKAMHEVLSQNLAKLDPKLADSVELVDEIDLIIKNTMAAEDVRGDKNKLEQLTKYIKLQDELDSCEKLVGQWNPLNKFSNIYNMMDSLQDQIEDFNTRSDDQSGAAPANRYGGPTPTNQSRQVDNISKRAQTFNHELDKLQVKLGFMKDVQYERAKIEFVFRLTERALESGEHLDAVLERLKVLETMHKDSPNIQTQIDEIKSKTATRIPESLQSEKGHIEKVQSELVAAVTELKRQVV